MIWDAHPELSVHIFCQGSGALTMWNLKGPKNISYSLFIEIHILTFPGYIGPSG